jgi:hypothetical protein
MAVVAEYNLDLRVGVVLGGSDHTDGEDGELEEDDASNYDEENETYGTEEELQAAVVEWLEEDIRDNEESKDGA